MTNQDAATRIRLMLERTKKPDYMAVDMQTLADMDALDMAISALEWKQRLADAVKNLTEACDRYENHYEGIAKASGKLAEIAVDAYKRSESAEPCTDAVSRQALLDELMETVEQHKSDQFGGQLIHWTGIKAMIECAPSVQPDVIHCRECRFFRTTCVQEQYEDWFCGDAERRTDD